MEASTELQQQLFAMQDLKYRDFHSKLLPGIDKETIIGIRTPVLRKFAKEYAKTEEAKAFLQELLIEIKQWVASKETYTIRYGIGVLMSLYLDEDFRPEYLEWVASVQSEEYYVNMMIAWYLATALAKQWDATVPYLEEKKLSEWVHKKTIQKAIESYRITSEQKVYLRSLRGNVNEESTGR